MSRKVSFTSERRAITPISYKAMRELMHSAQLNFSAKYMKDGGILRRNGLCRMGRDPQGRAILAFAADPDDFRLALPRERDEDIHHTSLQGAQFLEREGGFDNFHRIYGIYARAERTHEEWVIDQTRHFEDVRRRDFFDYGMLCRVSDDLWVSKAICYKRIPHMRKNPEGVREHARGKDGKLLYDITCTAAPGKGWDLTDIFDPSLSQRVAYFMGFVSKRWRAVPEGQEQLIIRRDVAKGVRRIMRGMDAYDLGEVEHYKPETLMDKILLKMGRYCIKLIHTSTFFNRSEITRLMLPLVVFAPMKKVAILGTALGKLVGYGMEKLNLDFGDPDGNNIITEFWPDNVIRRPIPDQYERLAPSKLLNICWLDAEEANVKPDGTPLYNEMPVDWAATYIWGIFNGPPGVEMSHVRVGKQSVLLARQPNGLVLEYWPQSDVVFARRAQSLRVKHDGIDFDQIRPLPKTVKSLLGHNDVIMVSRHKKSERLVVRPITAKEYTRVARNISRRKERDALAPKFDMSAIAVQPEMRPSYRLRAVSRSPVNPMIVDRWEGYEEQVPVGARTGMFGRMLDSMTNKKVAGSTLEEGVTEVGEGVVQGALKMALKR